MSNIKIGDILLYRSSNFVAKLVDIAEESEDGKQDKEYYHVAIALNSREKIEADGTAVVINPINFNEDFDIYTLTSDMTKIHKAMSITQKHLGEKYDWWEIADQALRDISDEKIHLPSGFIIGKEKHGKICSTLLKIYIEALDLGINIKDFPSPEDIYLAIAKYIGLEVNTEDTEEPEPEKTVVNERPEDTASEPKEEVTVEAESPQETEQDQAESPQESSVVDEPTTESTVETPDKPKRTRKTTKTDVPDTSSTEQE